MTIYDWNKYGYLLHCTHLKMIYFVLFKDKKIWDNKNRLDRKWNRNKIVFNISI